jgi:V/A-type H+-transporting ATPase subunit D
VSVSIGRRILPTKIELIRLRRSLKVARLVHSILEDKRDVLLKRLDEAMEEASRAAAAIQIPVTEAYDSLISAYMKLGTSRVEAIAETTPPSVEAEVSVKRVVDVDVPTLRLVVAESGPTYGFADTSVDLDQARMKMRNALVMVAKAAELENTIFRLASELEKTQRLINALENVIIPTYESNIRQISSALEESQREEFVRLKRIKAVLLRRRGEI